MEAAPSVDNDRRAPSSRKRRKPASSSSSSSSASSSTLRWRTESEQKMYSSKLVDALRHVRRRASSPPSLTCTRIVRDAADRALAFGARGRTRWSRAILLSSRRNLKLKVSRRKPKPPSVLPSVPVLAKKTAETVVPLLERKAKVLGRLVPGCRKLSFPALLDETSDYIAALQMQVRAMSALAEILSSSSTVLPSSSSDQG
ncbi:putative Transcription factor [Zostera marina]|uniref:Putative Transcription factor n=1 Tax=Zostera marina TaxID=29655 RepID=A0A0K9PZP6_ZOSMR|nr:putative Transcription factor [Zostera marina]